MVGIGGGGFVDTGGSFSTLNVPGARGTIPLGINHQGKVVGYFSGGSDGLQHGFIATPLPVFAGMPGKANCYGQSVSALAKQYHGLIGAATALGYPSISALQDAILAFCVG
jgi:hypothetical protein